jgi:hypothetical protein
MLALGVMDPRNSNKLPPFAMWPVFPASDYYGGSDAAHGHWPTAGLGIPWAASCIAIDALKRDDDRCRLWTTQPAFCRLPTVSMG